MAALAITGGVVRAQLTGTITVPNVTYPTLASVITALNTQGVGAGGVIINLTAATPQTAPVGGYQLGSAVLNASTSAANAITINGNNNTITAPVGTSTTVDGIFNIMGVDYLTINALNLTEAATNLASPTTMEAGYALINRNAVAPFDGCQNVTIQNCAVTLNRLSTNVTIGILSAHQTISSNVALTITATGDAHSNNKFYGNTISNCAIGIYIPGYADLVAPYLLYDQNNEVGGTTPATGNTLTNLGGNAGFNLFGILMINQNNPKANYNTVNNALGGVASIGQSIAIYLAGTNSNGTANNNNITLSVASGTSLMAGIYALNTGNVTLNNNTVALNNLASSGTYYGIYSAGIATTNINNNSSTAINGATALSNSYYMIYSGSTAVTENIDGNIINNVNLNTTGTVYMIYASNSTPTVSISNNKITNFTRLLSGTTYSIYNLGGPGSGTSTVNGNTISNFTTTGTGTVYGIYYFTGTGHNHVVTNDSVFNINTTSGAAAVYGVYVPSGNANNISNNYVGNISTGSGTVYGCYGTAGTGLSTVAGNFSNNIITGLSSAGSTMYCTYITGGNTYTASNNRIYNNSSTGTSATIYGMYVGGGINGSIYNNMISGLDATLSSGTSPLYGMYLSFGTLLNVYHNTINIAPTSAAGINFGATGIYYSSGIGSLDLRNNIVRVVATPAGTGTVVALRRSSGTAGVVPANLATTTNGNIYFVPNAANSYLYNESTSITAVNGFNTTNDPGFNTTCGLYKTFMAPREAATFTESNLTQIGTTGNYAPVGLSYAEGSAVATTAPAVTTDLNNVARGASPDRGALQFAGTAYADVIAPAISYTALPTATYCTAATLTATITDASGINTATGTRPRLYYKKSTEANVFGAGNTSAANGWKYVEATNTASPFTFNIDYSLLNTLLVVGDSITYFVVAQDLAATPNVGNSIIAFASGYCPSSVNVLAGGAPTLGSPVPNGYKVLALPVLTAVASPAVICVNGSTTISLTSALPAGTSIQWQQDNGTGTFVDITGATGTTYTTPVISTANNFRARILCGTTAVVTSSVAVVTINNPQILTAVSATRCGTGTVSLTATATAGTTIKWYTTATGGTAVGTGSPFVTPVISATTPYYVAASNTAAPANATIGAGALTTVTNASSSPYNGFYGGQRIQYLIPASELLAAGVSAGNFNSLSFDVVSNTVPSSFAGFTISLAPTALTALTTPPLVTTGFTQVYSAASVTPTVGINTYAFAPTFVWDGTSNIIVNICWSNVNGGGYYSEVKYDNTSYISTAYARTDNTAAATVCGNASGSSNSTYTNRPKMIFNYTGSCEGVRVVDSAKVTTPPAVVASSPQAPGVCSGSTATITATSANTNYTYSWSSGQTTASFTVTPAATTTYTVTATDAGTGCVAKDSVKINVSAQPGVPTLTPATATICAGSSQILTAANASTAGSPVSLLAESFEGTGLGLFTKTNGPLNTALAASDWAQYANGSSLSGVGIVTSPYGTKFAGANADGGGGSAFYTQTYLSTTGSYNTVGITNLNVSFRQYYYNYPGDAATLQASNDNGVTWNTVYTNPLAISGSATAFALINVPLTAYQNVTNLKLRFNYYSNWGFSWVVDSVNLYGTGASAGPGNINYTNVTGLYKDVALTQALSLTDTNKIVYASPATNQVYTVRTNSLGCLSAASNTSTITVNPAPSSAITFTGSTTFCQPSTLLLTAPAGTFTYQWRRNGIPIPGATGQTFAADSTGAYTVTVTNTTPCSSTTTVPVNIIANPAPPTAITASGTTSFCVGGSVTLSAPLPPAGTTYTYVWKDNGVAIAGQTGATLVVTTSRNVTVTVTNTTTTCSATTSPATVVTVGPPPPAIVTAAGPTTFCQGSSVKLRTSNAAGLTYQWSNASGPIPGATDSTYTTTVAGTFTVTIQAGGPTCQSTSLPTTVTVNPNPFAAITASGAPTTFCSGGNVVLTATPPGLNYQWLIGGAPTTPPGSGQTYTASATGTYTAVVTNPATGCFATSNGVAVTVNPLPVATISPSATTTICAGNSTTLTANTGTGLTYQWFNGASAITGATAATYSASTAGSYTVLVTNANGCFATSNATVIIVTPLPVTTTTPSGPVNLCTNDTLTIVGPTGTGYTYQWRIGATNAAGVSTVRDYKATTSGVYTVIVTANGCSATSAATTVTLLPLPIALLSPTAPTTGCDSVVLSSASTGVTYQWRYNGNNIIGANSATYSATASGNYSLRVTGTNGCSAATTGAGTAITINPSPNGTITYSSPLVFCQGGAVVLNTYSGANLSYQWLRDTTTIAGANTTSYITSQSGLYSVKVINTVTGCGKVSLPVIVRVNALPNPVIVYNSGLNELSTVQTFAQYQWYKNTQPQTGTEAYTRFYHPSSNGAYSVSVTDTNGCVNISQITFVNSVGIRNTGASAGVKVYPNPTSGVLHVESSVKVNLLLRDVTGKAVLKANDAEELNIGQLADGMYLLYITDMQGGLIRAEKVTKSTR